MRQDYIDRYIYQTAALVRRLGCGMSVSANADGTILIWLSFRDYVPDYLRPWGVVIDNVIGICVRVSENGQGP